MQMCEACGTLPATTEGWEVIDTDLVGPCRTGRRIPACAACAADDELVPMCPDIRD